MSGVECSAISRVKVVITPSFLRVRVTAVKAPCLTGIGAPCATKAPARLGVEARLGKLMIPARPKPVRMPRDDRPGIDRRRQQRVDEVARPWSAPAYRPSPRPVVVAGADAARVTTGIDLALELELARRQVAVALGQDLLARPLA